MVIKLFILGLPGSGKSTAFRHIESFLKNQWPNWQVVRINDYHILRDLFQAERETLRAENKTIRVGQGMILTRQKRRFRPLKHDGFNVLDYSALDEALQIARKGIEDHLSSKTNCLIVIEFARNDYSKALRIFETRLVRDAYFLLLEAEVAICRVRLRQRTKNRVFPDDHYVSQSIFKSYYKDTEPYTPSNLYSEHGVEDFNVKVIRNNGPVRMFLQEVEGFMNHILKRMVEKNLR